MNRRFPRHPEVLWKLIRCCVGEGADIDGIAADIVMKCRNGKYIDGVTERDMALFGRLNLPEWFPEYARKIISLCHRSGMMAKGIKMVKDTWLRMQVER